MKKLIISAIIALAIGVAIGYAVRGPSTAAPDKPDTPDKPATPVLTTNQTPAQGRDMRYHRDLADVHLRYNEAAEAYQNLEAALKLATQPQDRIALMCRLAEADLKSGKKDAGSKRLDEAITVAEAHKHVDIAYRGVTGACMSAKAWDLAEKHLKDWLAATASPTFRNKIYTDLAKVSKEQGKIDAFIAEMEAELKKNPKDHAILSALQFTHRNLKYSPTKAAARAADLLSQSKNRSQKALLYRQAAESYAAQGDYPKAIQQLDQAITLNTDQRVAMGYRLLLGKLYQSNKQLKEAEREFLFVADNAANPSERSVAERYLLLLFRSQKRLKELSDLYETRLTRDPNDLRVNLFLGDLYMQQKRTDKAVVCFHNALRLNPRNTQTITRLAEAYDRQSKYDLSAQYYSKLTEMSPANAAYYQERIARVYIKAGRYKEAAACVDKIAATKPAHFSHRLYIAELYVLCMEQFKADNAQRLALAAAKTDREKVICHFRLADTYAKTGNVAQAEAMLNHVITNFRDPSAVIQARQKLKALSGTPVKPKSGKH